MRTFKQTKNRIQKSMHKDLNKVKKICTIDYDDPDSDEAYEDEFKYSGRRKSRGMSY